MGRTEVPFSIYERPSAALMNLIRGDVPAAAQSLLSPMELSPDEAQTIRSRLLRGKMAEDPILKTATSLVTNPLFIAGAVMAMLPAGRITNPRAMYDLIRAGGRELAPIVGTVKHFMSPLTSMRNLWSKGLIDPLMDMTRFTREFQHEVVSRVDDARDVFMRTTGRGISDREQNLVALFMEGWHKEVNPIKGRYPKMLKDVKVLAPGLMGELKKNPALMDFANRMSATRDWAKKKLFEGVTEGGEEIAAALKAKGVEPRNDYFHRVIMRSGMDEQALLKTGPLSLRTQMAQLRAAARKGIPKGPMKEFHGFSIPLKSHLDEVADVVDPRVIQKFEGMTEKMSKSVGEMLSKVGKEVRVSLNRGIPWEQIKSEVSDTRLMRLVAQETKMRGMDETAPGRIMEYIRLAATKGDDAIEQMSVGLSRILGAPARYSLRSADSMKIYGEAAAPMYGWWSKGLGKRLTDIFKDPGVPTWQRQLWEGDGGLMMMLQGFRHPKEFARAADWADKKVAMRLWWNNSDLVKGMVEKGILPKKTFEWVNYGLSDARGSWSERSISGSVSHVLQMGTLGGNVGYIYKNLFQPFLTTFNVVGAGSMMRGLREFTKRIPGYLDDVGRIGKDKAFIKAFPEYHEAFGPENLMEAMRVGDIAKEGGVKALGKGVWKKGQEALMWPGMLSEKFVRMWAHYSGLDYGVKGGLAADEAQKVARFITFTTQFSGGITGQPNALRGVMAPIRQFAHFPMRMVDFMRTSTAFGNVEGKASLGTMGRTLATSAAIYEVGKGLLGTNLAPALVFAAMPNPTVEGAPLYPFPFVPPAAGLAFSAIQGLDTGDYTNLKRAAWMTVPGGLAGSRAYRSFSPKYADYGRRTPDGKIPVYNNKGMMTGSYTPIQLVMKGLGLSPSDTQKESDMIKYLIRQRERIREYRRNYLERLTENDLGGAGKISREFQKEFPGVGPLLVKKADLRAVENRKQMSRLSRVLKGFPKEYRPIFERVVSEAGLSEMAQDVEFDPSVLESYL